MLANFFNRIKRVFNDTSIKNKLLLSYLVLIFVPLIFLVTVSWMKISQNFKSNMYNLAAKALEQTDSYLEYKLGYITNISDIIMLQETIQEVLTRDMSTYSTDYMQQVIDAETLSLYFNSFENTEDINLVRLYVQDCLSYSEGNKYFLNINKASQKDWFNQVLEPYNQYHWFPFEYFKDEESNEGPIVCLLRRVIDSSNYRNTVGVLRIDVREAVLNDIISKANVVDSGLTFIVNSRGEIITSYGNGTISNDFIKEAILDNKFSEEKVWTNITIADKLYVSAFTDIKKTDWKLFTLIPYDEILKTGSDIRDFMLVIMFISAVVAYLTAYYLVHATVNRIKSLGDNMHKVKDGDFDIQVPVTNNDEIGQLTRDFNYMVKEMAIMIQERFAMGKKIKNLELKALQAQINPHFLYNSLDMINWTAAINGITEIEIMVQALAKFYKLSLSKGAEIISIRDEIEHVKAYITIQNLRYDNGIKFILDIDEDIYQYSIIKIILQPIIENAIIHGILKKNERKGTIVISGKLNEGNIVFTVKDDGSGMDRNMIDKIFNNPKETKSYGIRNINDRIALHYGPKYGMSFHSEVGKGTEVTITIPAIKSGESFY